MKNQEFSPRESLERAFGLWWVIVLMTALGGIAGWAFHFLLPPVYEATAVITANMDYQKRALTQNEEDYIFNAAGAIGTSTKLENQIVTDAQTQGLSISLDQLKQQLFIEREQSVWKLHIRNRDPKVAAQLANLWSEKFFAALNTDLGHAIQADQIQAQINSINGSLLTSGPSVISPKTQATLKNLTDRLKQEKQSSQGIISIMKFTQTESATAPQSPVLYRLANFVLAGACIGFVVSLWVASSIKVQHHA